MASYGSRSIESLFISDLPMERLFSSLACVRNNIYRP
jgi:hypothetical protein